MKVPFILSTIAVATTTVCVSAFSTTFSTLNQQERLQPLRSHSINDNEDESSLTKNSPSTTRRSFFGDVAAIASAGVTVASVNSINPDSIAWASGGATAGGAYLLSAKQRYNERVIAGIKELLGVVDSLKSGSLDSARAYFIARDDTGSWKDLTAAGYLLSNAFRTSSSTPPERLPSVKKYKAFVAEIDNMIKLLKNKKGGAEQAAAAFESTVEASLNDWLAEIELPAAREL